MPILLVFFLRLVISIPFVPEELAFCDCFAISCIDFDVAKE